MTLKARIVKEALKRKGFVEDTSGHHMYYRYFFQDRQTTINTRISHGEIELDSWLIGKMAKQVKLPKNQFLELISCTLTHDDYRDRLLAEGHIRE